MSPRRDLPPHLQRVHGELMAAARRTADTARRRRPSWWRLPAIALAAITVSGGAVLAATGTNPLDWLRGGDPARDLRVAPDPTRRVEGDFPQSMVCRQIATVGQEVDCRASPEATGCVTITHTDGSAERTCTGPTPPAIPGVGYDLVTRIVAVPKIDPERLATYYDDWGARLLVPDVPGRLGTITGTDAAGIIRRMTPAFWNGVRRVLAAQGGTSSASGSDTPPGYELVPPPGVARYATCVADHGDFRCRAITNGEGLPVGAPLYSLGTTPGWRRVRVRSNAEQVAGFNDLMRQAFGRPLTEDEQIAFFAVAQNPVRFESAPSSGRPAPEVSSQP